MSKIKYRDIKLAPKNRLRLQQINNIITEYQKLGYRLTLRQLYYQLVSRDVIPNHKSEYQKLSILLKEGRMAGIVDWDAIVDRLRAPSKPPAWEDAKEFMKSVVPQFAVPHLKGQDNYIKVWVEKDALSEVLSRVTEEFHIPIVVNRGYSSATAMHDAYRRFKKAIQDGADFCYVLYVGDFDPSGIDMIRDIRDRIAEFDTTDIVNFTIQPIALTREQIDEYNPPPNPAKMQDPRAGKFVDEHGTESWEVDALRPEVLDQILRDAIEPLVNADVLKRMIDHEEDEMGKLVILKDSLFEEDEDNE